MMLGMDSHEKNEDKLTKATRDRCVCRKSANNKVQRQHFDLIIQIIEIFAKWSEFQELLIEAMTNLLTMKPPKYLI